MTNKGFSAAVDYFGTIAGLTKKSSNDNATSQLAECQDMYGDTVAKDGYGAVIAPSVEYAVTGTVDFSKLALGTVYAVGNGKVMLTSISVTSNAGTPPTVTLSGVQVESDAATKRTYAIAGTLTPRAKAQDVAGAFVASTKYTGFTTTFSIDSAVETVTGTPVASDSYHGRIEVQATMSDGDGTGAITLADGFTFSAEPASGNPDAGYISRTATAVKFVSGTEVSA